MEGLAVAAADKEPPPFCVVEVTSGLPPGCWSRGGDERGGGLLEREGRRGGYYMRKLESNRGRIVRAGGRRDGRETSQ